MNKKSEIDLDVETKILRSKSALSIGIVLIPFFVIAGCALSIFLGFELRKSGGNPTILFLMPIFIVPMGLGIGVLYWHHRKSLISNGVVFLAEINSITKLPKGACLLNIKYEVDGVVYKRTFTEPHGHAKMAQEAGGILIVTKPSKPKASSPLHMFTNSTRKKRTILKLESGLS